jgi:hypothetical protein
MALNKRAFGTLNQSLVSGQKLRNNYETYRNKPQYIETIDINLGMCPLTVLSDRMGAVGKVGYYEYFHLEDDALPQFVQVNNGGGYNSAATSIVVDTGTGIRVRKYDLLFNPLTLEQLSVTDVSTDTLTVVRGHGGSTAAAIADDTQLQILSFSAVDGDTSPTALSNEPKQLKNYCMIARESVNMSRRAAGGDLYGNKDEWTRAKEKVLQRLNIKTEKQFLFGQRDDGATNYRSTGGLLYWLSTNKVNVAGNLTEAAMNAWLRDLFRESNPDDMVFLCGEFFRETLDQWGRDRLTNYTKDDMMGIATMGYKTTFGELKIVPHGLLSAGFDGNATSTVASMAGMVFAVNMKKFKKVYYGDQGKLHFNDNIQANDADGRKGEYLMDYGAYLGKESAHGMLYGITSLLG